MKVLLLGGTRFLGRHLVDSLSARGHEITLFNRGQTNGELYPALEKLVGDRNGDLAALKGRSWDAVIDTCGYLPRLVRASAELLSERVAQYVFISTVSVYPDPEIPGLDENSGVGRLLDPSVEEITEQTYGPLKVLCEGAVEKCFPGRSLIVRPGLIVGPYDPTDRFTYWPGRIAQGGEVLVPGRPEFEVQFIDARDLADWIALMLEERRTGVYNATGPREKTTMQDLLRACQEVTEKSTTLTWVDNGFLAERGLTGYCGRVEDPFWLPEEQAGMLGVNCSRAISQGLTYRPLVSTIRDTLAWARSLDRAWLTGLSPAQERELLSAWKEVLRAPLA